MTSPGLIPPATPTRLPSITPTPLTAVRRTWPLSASNLKTKPRAGPSPGAIETSGTRYPSVARSPANVTPTSTAMPASSAPPPDRIAPLTVTALAAPAVAPISVIRPRQPQAEEVGASMTSGVPGANRETRESGTEISTSKAPSESTCKTFSPRLISEKGSTSRAEITPSKGASRRVLATSRWARLSRELSRSSCPSAASASDIAWSSAALATQPRSKSCRCRTSSARALSSSAWAAASSAFAA